MQRAVIEMLAFIRAGMFERQLWRREITLFGANDRGCLCTVVC